MLSFRIIFISLFSLLLSLIGINNIAVAEEVMDNEGQMIVKARLQGLFPQQKQKFNNQPVAGQSGVSRKQARVLGNSSVGGELATTFFFDNSFSGELALGLSGYKLKGLDAINTNYSTTNPAVIGKSKKTMAWFMPLTATVQYNIPMYGDFQPYIGLGYSYIFVSSSKSVAKFTNPNGPVVQLGFDAWVGDNIGVNVDAKKYWTKATVKYGSGIAVPPLKGKLIYDPWVVAAGVAYKF